MKIPKIGEYPTKVYLRGDCYKIKFVKGMRNLGETDSSKQVIRIKAGMSRNETFRTLLHELLHFIEFTWPIKIKHKQVYKLEKALFQLLVDNFL